MYQIIHNSMEITSAKIIASLLLLFGFFFGDIYKQAILSVMMLITIDTFFGVISAYYEGSAITSRKFGRIVQKSTVYMLAISAGYFADITIGWQIIESVMIGFIGVTEFISILENMGRLGYQTPKKLLNQLKDFQSQK
jgi:toxin secretion/phage lysis holin